MRTFLKRYWIKFEESDALFSKACHLGLGVTAYDFEDARRLIKEKVFKNEDVPPIKQLVENVDIRTLEQNHIAPNMGSPNLRGIWFPMGYS